MFLTNKSPRSTLFVFEERPKVDSTLRTNLEEGDTVQQSRPCMSLDSFIFDCLKFRVPSGPGQSTDLPSFHGVYGREALKDYSHRCIL